MQQFRFATADTSKTIDVFLPDSSSTTGAGLAGLVFNTANFKAYYRNTATGTVTAITLATQTVGGAWSSGGFVELDATNAKGMYRLDVPNAVLTSAGEGFIHFYGATNLAQTPVQISVGYVAVNVTQVGGSTASTATTVDANAVEWGGMSVTGMPMPTYTQPTGFLAATFPSDPADQSLVIAATDAILSKLLKYVQAMTRSDTANATDRAAELTEINADGGSGAGDWNPARLVGGAALETLGSISDNAADVLNHVSVNGVVLSSTEDVYHADIDFTRDQSNTQDDYSVVWMKNGVPQLSGVTVPTIQVIKRADATDLIASTAMTDVGSNILTYNALTTERQTQGEAVIVVVTATIDAATRTFARVLGRDST